MNISNKIWSIMNVPLKLNDPGCGFSVEYF